MKQNGNKNSISKEKIEFFFLSNVSKRVDIDKSCTSITCERKRRKFKRNNSLLWFILIVSICVYAMFAIHTYIFELHESSFEMTLFCNSYCFSLNSM